MYCIKPQCLVLNTASVHSASKLCFSIVLLRTNYWIKITYNFDGRDVLSLHFTSWRYKGTPFSILISSATNLQHYLNVSQHQDLHVNFHGPKCPYVTINLCNDRHYLAVERIGFCLYKKRYFICSLNTFIYINNIL